MAVMNELEMNKGNQLSEEQIERIILTVKTLADHSNNAQAITLAHNLKMSRNIEEKRKWIVLFYVSQFQLLTFINLARDKELPIDAYKIELEKKFRIENGK